LKRKGRKSAAQTPAPQNERVYGSDKNPIGSAASQTSASKIKLSPGILTTLKNKVDKYNERHKKKVSLATAKAVMRRGMGAYSKSHRPTITGGAPNSRQAWGFARVNKFLLKKSGEPVKKAYVQDDDLLASGGKVKSKNDTGQANFGEPDKSFYNRPLIHETRKENLKSILNNGFNKSKNENITMGVYTIPEKWKGESFGDGSSRGGVEISIKLKDGAKIFWSDTDRPMDFYNGRGNKYFVKLFKELSNKKSQWLSFEDRIKYLRKFEKWLSQNGYCGVQQGGEIVITDLSCIDSIEKYKRNKYADGGDLGDEIKCVRCAWSWNTKDSDESDKYVCHKCGFDNRTYYDGDIIGKAESHLLASPEQIKTENIEQMENIEPIMVDCEIVETELPVGKLAKGMTLSEVAAHHGLKAEDLQKAINDGIETEMEHTDSSEIARAIALDHLYEDPKYYDKLKEIEKPNQKAEGGHVMDDDGNLTNDGKKGGYFKGRSHAEGGIKAVNVDTKTPIEVEGDEVIITKSAVRDPKKRNFEGKMMTNREILSKINQSGGGVAFADGGETSDCGCNQYDEGGKTESDIAIMSCKEIEVLLDGLFKLSVQAPELIDSIKENIIYLKKLQIVQNC